MAGFKNLLFDDPDPSFVEDEDASEFDTINAMLMERLDDLSYQLFGSPTRTTRDAMYWGKRSLTRTGRHFGTYWATGGRATRPIGMIMDALDLDPDGAVEFAREFLGPDADYTPRRFVYQPSLHDVIMEERHRVRRIHDAQQLWGEAVPLRGRLGERYLTETRLIPAPAGGWPDTVRYHPHNMSLILAAGGAATRDVQFVQQVFLNSTAKKRGGDHAKRTTGVMGDDIIRLPGPADGPLQIAEGPETGLSAWRATGHETWITVGTVTRVTPPRGRQVIICRDDDLRWSPNDRLLNDQIHEWRKDGLRIAVATPWPIRRGDSTDLNDVVRAGGIEAVQERILLALNPDTDAPRRVPVHMARQVLGDAMDECFRYISANQDWSFGHPQFAIKVCVALGKSSIARRKIAEMLTAMRAAGDLRTVVMAVPTHSLGDEQAERFEALPEANTIPTSRLTARVWRGRTGHDPAFPDDDKTKTMCMAPERVKDALAAGAPVQTAACRQKPKKGPAIECPLYDTCAFQQQHAWRADLWIVAHEMLFTLKPKAIGDIALIVVDESAWEAGLVGHDRPMAMSVDTFKGEIEMPNAKHDPLVPTLSFIRRRAVEMLDALPLGPIRRDEAKKFLTSFQAEDARAMEWKRKVEPNMDPAMSDADRKAAVEGAAVNREIRLLTRFWHSMVRLLADDGPAASGWLALDTEDTDAGQVRVIRMKGKRKMGKGWLAPTILIDANLNVELNRQFWPNVNLVADVDVDAPHMFVRQVRNSAFSKSKLVGFEKSGEAEDDPDRIKRMAATARNVEKLHGAICAIGRAQSPRQVLVVSQKAVEEQLRALGNIPPNVAMDHHNNISGKDIWKKAAGLVVVGRTMLSPGDAERIAEALTGEAIPHLTPWHEKRVVHQEMRSGEWIQADADRHPHPIAEAVRWEKCEGELIQIVGRMRGINRTEDTPVGVLIATDVPLPIVVDELINADELTPSPQERMLAAGGIAFENPTDAAMAYDLWDTRNAAKMAFRKGQDGGWGAIPKISLLLPNRPQPPSDRSALRRIDYQCPGAGRSPAIAWFDPNVVSDPAARLGALLGEVTWAKV